jgi:hypothetical protein
VILNARVPELPADVFDRLALFDQQGGLRVAQHMKADVLLVIFRGCH